MDQPPEWRPRGRAGGLAALLLLMAPTASTPALAQTAAPTGSPAGPPGIFGQATFPGKQRPAGDPAVIARGQALFGINCKACHGADLRGGDLGGPNLLRSALVLGDQAGEAIVPVVRQGRPASQGGTPMPAFALPPADATAISEYIHSIVGRKANQGGPPPPPEKPLNILVGDPGRGAQYFALHCGSCHSASGDLRGIASRVANPATLQDSWVAGRRSGAPVAGAPAPAATQVLVTLNGGGTVQGTLKHLDDFTVSLITAQGQYRSFIRQGPAGVRTVQVRDPLQQHRELLTQYTDQDMHDITAYLATLK
jgi:cytochrome c oxidase cbb3-type subunit 3